MNKAYRSVWNDATGTWVAVQENACGRSKQSRSNSKVLAVASSGVAAVAALMAAPAYAGSNTVALFNDGVDNGCSAIYDNWSTSNWTDARCSVSLGNAGTAVSIGMNSTNGTGTRVLTGVSNGAVSASSVDAVNGSQLYATNQSISNLAGDITNISGKMADAVMYDSSAHDSVTLGGAGATSAVALHNVAAGDVTASSTDAVNGSQLYSLMQDVNNIASNASDPMFTANGDRNTEAASASGTHATAAGANANASGTQATAIGANSVASGVQSVAIGASSTATGSNSVALGAGSVADRANAVSVGSAGNERQITNVAAGTQGTDAVNVNQLNDAISNAAAGVTSQVQQGVQAANAYTNQQISVVRKQMNSLGAAAMAATSLIPNARAEGNFQMTVAAGTYGGESALALGANWYVSDRVLLNAHVSRATGSGAGTGASVGATIGF